MHQHAFSFHFFISLRQVFRLQPALCSGHIAGFFQIVSQTVSQAVSGVVSQIGEIAEVVKATLWAKLGRQTSRNKMHKEKSNVAQGQSAPRCKANALFTRITWQGMTVVFCCFWFSANLCAEEYMSQQAFLQKAFSDKKYEPQMVWLDTEAKAIAENKQKNEELEQKKLFKDAKEIKYIKKLIKIEDDKIKKEIEK